MSAQEPVRQEPADASLRRSDPLYARMVCPSCATDTLDRKDNALTRSRIFLVCSVCETEYPLIRCGKMDIAWAFPFPIGAHREWSARFRAELQRLTEEHNRLNQSLSRSRTTPRGRRRLATALRAVRHHRENVLDIMEPYCLERDDVVPAVTQNVRERLPVNQRISSYASNVFRDWAWNNGENEALLEAVDLVISNAKLESLGSALTLGSGAGRLTFDVHQRYAPELSVALDINPLLIAIACRIAQGDRLSLYEFPPAPIDGDQFAVCQECVAPDDTAGDIRFVVADAIAPPFAAQSFDTVITPWLIDTLPQDLCNVLSVINRLLPTGGVWINTGTVAFHHRDPRRRFSETEVLELAEDSGFEILSLDHRVVPYMQSPCSGHGRVERITSFAARKTRNIELSGSNHHLPEWLLDSTLPVPGDATSSVEASGQLLKAQVFAAVDGKRTLEDIAILVSREYGLPMEDCRHAVRRILIDPAESAGFPFSDWMR